MRNNPPMVLFIQNSALLSRVIRRWQEQSRFCLGRVGSFIPFGRLHRERSVFSCFPVFQGIAPLSWLEPGSTSPVCVSASRKSRKFGTSKRPSLLGGTERGKPAAPDKQPQVKKELQKSTAKTVKEQDMNIVAWIPYF